MLGSMARGAAHRTSLFMAEVKGAPGADSGHRCHHLPNWRNSPGDVVARCYSNHGQSRGGIAAVQDAAKRVCSGRIDDVGAGPPPAFGDLQTAPAPLQTTTPHPLPATPTLPHILRLRPDSGSISKAVLPSLGSCRARNASAGSPQALSTAQPPSSARLPGAREGC